MSHCGVHHPCPDGRTGECGQDKGHLTRHLCRDCLAFFSDDGGVGPVPRGPAATGTHPSVHSLLQMDAARSSTSPTAPQGRFRLFGLWQATIGTPLGELHTTLVLHPDERFTQTAVLNGLLTYDEGTIELGAGFVHFVVKDHQPKKYHGVDVKWLESWTFFYTVVDADTMTFEDRVAGSAWTVHRG
jgi:hypothetical protein